MNRPEFDRWVKKHCPQHWGGSNPDLLPCLCSEMRQAGLELMVIIGLKEQAKRWGVFGRTDKATGTDDPPRVR